MVLSVAPRMRLKIISSCLWYRVKRNMRHLPFFNQLSHLGAASIVMTRVFGKGSGFAQFVKEGDIGLEGFLFVCLLASKK